MLAGDMHVKSIFTAGTMATVVTLEFTKCSMLLHVVSCKLRGRLKVHGAQLTGQANGEVHNWIKMFFDMIDETTLIGHSFIIAIVAVVSCFLLVDVLKVLLEIFNTRVAFGAFGALDLCNWF